MPPLRLEREWRERTNSATIVNRCTEFDRRKTTESVTERLPQLNPSKILAFTMAEILLSLTIIGVVAAITLPSLTGKRANMEHAKESPLCSYVTGNRLNAGT